MVASRHAVAADRRHVRARSSRRSHVDAHEGGRHKAKVGERRVAAADVGRISKDGAKVLGQGLVVQRGAGVGDGDEVAPRLAVAQALADAVVEVGVKQAVSVVPPDLLDTMNRVRSRSRAASVARTAAGSVESQMRRWSAPSAGAKVRLSTSGARLEPPMPSSTASV